MDKYDDHFKVTVLTGPNYLRWKYDVEITLKGKNLWTIISGERVHRTVVKAATANESEQVTVDTNYEADMFRALKIISDSLNDKYHKYIIGIQDAKTAWEKLISILENTSSLSKNDLNQQYYAIEYEGDTDLYFSKMRLTIQNLRNVGVVIDDSQAVAKLVTDFARVNVHTDFCSHYNFSSRDPNFSMSLDQAEQMILSAIRKQPDDTTAVSLASSSSTKFTRTEKVQSGKVGKRNLATIVADLAMTSTSAGKSTLTYVPTEAT